MQTSRNRFPLVMKATAAVTALLTVVFALLQLFLRRGWILSCAITFGTTCYHFSMRLLVGALVPNTFDYRRKWFQPKPWEAVLYRKMHLKRWKTQVPTYNPDSFSFDHNTPEQILRNMCQAEVVHEIIIVCSFLPLLLVFLFGTFPVFLITSILAAAFDSVFILLQRFNRPRLLRLSQKRRKTIEKE